MLLWTRYGEVLGRMWPPGLEIDTSAYWTFQTNAHFASDLLSCRSVLPLHLISQKYVLVILINHLKLTVNEYKWIKRRSDVSVWLFLHRFHHESGDFFEVEPDLDLHLFFILCAHHLCL